MVDRDYVEDEVVRFGVIYRDVIGIYRIQQTGGFNFLSEDVRNAYGKSLELYIECVPESIRKKWAVGEDTILENLREIKID